MAIQQKWCDPREDIVAVKLADGITYNHYYRYMADETDLYMFGCGLGDQAMMEQAGYSFLRYIDQFGDPELGRICVSVGTGQTAFIPYKGDINCAWVIAFSDRVNWAQFYLQNVLVKPQLWLCPSKTIQDILDDAGMETLYLPLGVGDVFKPLDTPRKGIGYTGLDTKTPEQMAAIIHPMIDREGFEWRGRNAEGPFMHLWELNEWYNQKQAVFGMFFPLSMQMGLVTGRVFETLGSGTPLICYKNPAINEILGRDYMHQSSSAEETVELVEGILEHPDATNCAFAEWSRYIHEHHNYLQRITTLIKRLEEMKK